MMSRIGNKQRAASSVQRVERRRIRHAPRVSKGLTLVEILLAVVILSIGVAGVLRAYAGSVHILEISQENIEAMSLLKEKMSDLQQEMIEEGGVSAGSSTGNFEGDFSNYAWELAVQPTLKEGLHELDLVVYHPDRTRKFSLTTYVENKDYEKKD
jgi:prepilin-type N-terminal cleavage/methylation domain-containing protein